MEPAKAEILARQVINQFQLSPPINLDLLLKQYRITLIFRRLHKDEAMLFKAGKEKVLVIDDRQSPGQARFNIAHEFGHDILEHNGNIFTNPRNKLNKSPEDIEADIFASELLIPTPILKKESERFENNLEILACIFKVTLQAMATKMSIKEMTYNSLYEEQKIFTL